MPAAFGLAHSSSYCDASYSSWSLFSCPRLLRTVLLQIWEAPHKIGQWTNIIIGLKLSRKKEHGWIEIYHNGQLQELKTGVHAHFVACPWMLCNVAGAACS